MACELCGREGAPDPFYPRFGIIRCPRCRLVFFPGPVETGPLYGDAYFRGGEYLDYAGDEAVLKRNFRRRVRELRRFSPGGSLLEIGAAFGFFLDVARDLWQVRGLEISPEGAKHIRDVIGADVIQGDFLDLPDEPDRYDVICMWDTVEHLTHPVRYIEKAARWLKPGGVLAMTTGDVGSLLARLRKDRWRQIHPPTHLFYFSRETLSDAVQRAGLEVCHTSHVGHSRSYRAMMHSLFVTGRKRRDFLYAAATFGGRLHAPITINLHDILLLIARKPATTAPRAAAARSEPSRESPSHR